MDDCTLDRTCGSARRAVHRRRSVRYRRTVSARPSTREIPLRYEDSFRGGVAIVASLAGVIAGILPLLIGGAPDDRLGTFSSVLLAACLGLSLFSLVYLVWTHRLFARTEPDEARRIAAIQHRTGPGRFARLLWFGGTEGWALTAAATALVFAIAALLIGAHRNGVWLPALVLLTAATSWATVVYAFALRYFRLHSAGERIDFDIAEDPVFVDFLSMSVMVSSVGAMSAGTPRTRAGLSAVRTHTFIAFAFNALVVAMVVSLLTTVIASAQTA